LAFAVQHPRFGLLFPAFGDTAVEKGEKREIDPSAMPQLAEIMRLHSVAGSSIIDRDHPEPGRSPSTPLSTAATRSSFRSSVSPWNFQDSQTPASTVFLTPSRRRPQDTSVVRQACWYDCHCRCHSLDSMNSRKVTGGKGGGPKRSKVLCTDMNCRGFSAVEEKFDMQSKSFRRILSNIITTKSMQARYELNTYRMVSEGSDAIRHVKHGNLEKLKGCIESGDATIWDTAPDGWSLLHVRLAKDTNTEANSLIDCCVSSPVSNRQVPLGFGCGPRSRRCGVTVSLDG
jgi:hypothetical protein